MTELLSVALLLFVAGATCHYVLSLVWNHNNGVLIASAVFAVLCVIFKVAL